MKREKYPEWVLKHKEKGKAVHFINGKYYLYKIKSEWNSEKKRAVKKTVAYLGTITEGGLKEPKYKRVIDEIKEITVKEFGATKLLESIAEKIKKNLKKVYPDFWESIFTFASLRFFENSPIKNLNYYFTHSHLSELYPNSKLRPKDIGKLLEYLGGR